MFRTIINFGPFLIFLLIISNAFFLPLLVLASTDFKITKTTISLLWLMAQLIIAAILMYFLIYGNAIPELNSNFPNASVRGYPKFSSLIIFYLPTKFVTQILQSLIEYRRNAPPGWIDPLTEKERFWLSDATAIALWSATLLVGLAFLTNTVVNIDPGMGYGDGQLFSAILGALILSNCLIPSAQRIRNR